MRTYPVTNWVFFVAALSCATLVASLPCSPDLQVSWVVDNSATASQLARAANCSGGAFDVEWIGHIKFPETIYVMDGTVMNITGAGVGAAADGVNSTQYLNVVNAALRVSGLRIQNCAAVNSGGAIYAEASAISFNETTWSNNIAGEDGGGIFVYNSSSVSWSGKTSWFGNTAGGHGGAVYVQDSSDVSWSVETAFSNNNAGGHGGAMFVGGSSGVSWSGKTTWSDNRAGNASGAVHVFDSSGLSWGGEMIWSNNIAGGMGGAMEVYLSSTVSWSGETAFLNNTAGYDGGAILVSDSSNMSWSGETVWSDNSAGRWGGAVAVFRSSNVSWSGEMAFLNNTADFDGGAVIVFHCSGVSWSGETVFFNNNAETFGGAVDVGNSSGVSFSGETTWSNNTGANGGAVAVMFDAEVSFSGETMWSNNTAVEVGGAVSVMFDSEVSFSGETTWSHNTAGEIGGALHAQGAIVSMISSSLFECNTAGAGGAVMLSSVIIGPEFIRTNFIANEARRGGAVYSVSSGIEYDDLGNRIFPVVYEDCLFTDNWASIAGGAIESAAGYDYLVNTVFERNAAGVGGALRLGGSAVLNNCSFADNTAQDEGPATSNLGVLGLEGNSSRFSGNVFSCENGTYLDDADGSRYETVCDGCPGNNSDWIVSMENEDKVPICVVQLEHTRSEGGDTTIETLALDAGYWRATNESVNILACYNEDACTGGMTDDPAFCQLGYEGPYCSVCSGGFTKSLAFTCTKCVDDDGGIAIMVVVGVFVLGAAIALCKHLASGEMEGARRGVVHRVIKRLPFQSIKIIVVVWQILTQFSSVANVTYPDVYQRFLDAVNILNFDVLWIPSAGCLVEVSFHGRLLASTIGPLVVLALLAITYTVAKRRSSGSEADLQKIRHRHMSMVLLITFLVYSSVSATVFQTFACEDLDDRKNYLRADYRIDCDSSEHQAFQVFAGIMVLVYPAGIPLLYGYLLYKNRRVLKSEDEGTRETSPQVQPISDLWAPYKPGRFYYEVIECVRRMSLTGVVVFIYPNTSAQIAVTLVVAFLFVVVSERLAPYVSKWDASISLMGHVIVFTSMYTALLSKVDVSDERADSQDVFAGILVAAHACMVVAVIVETVVIVFSLRRNEGPFYRGNGPRPGVYYKGSVAPLHDPVPS